MNIRNFGNNVNEHYVQLAKKIFADRAERNAQITTKEQAQQYVADLKNKMEKIFAFPERTPLNPVITGKKVYDGYTMETLYYYSRPDYPVTANFFLPAEFTGKLPGVLFVCGHSLIGKAAEAYISCAVSLAKKGFAVLSIDPVEQGERKQYTSGGLCPNHNLMGKQQCLVGEWFGAWRTYDGVRGLDYLESRPEVDAQRLCVTGNSGGGTLTTWIAAADPRPIAVAPSCYITSWKHNVENELPADIEQMPPDAWKYGMEMPDFLLAQAPRDILILGQTRDFFDPRGTAESYEDVKRINDLLGGRTALHIGPDPHGYTKSNRQAMYRFFTENVLGKADGEEEPELKLPAQEETYAANGNIATIPGQKYLREFTVAKLAEMEAARPSLDLAQTRAILADLLQIGKVEVPHFRSLRLAVDGSQWVTRLGLETEPDQIMSILYYHYGNGEFYNVDRAKQKGIIYVSDQEALTELKERFAAASEDADTALYGLDVRGFGELMPSGCSQPEVRDFYAPYEFDYHYASLGIMNGRPILGDRVKDVLATVELLAANGYTEITLEGNGLGAISALLAGVLSDKVTKVKLTGSIESYAQIIRMEMTDFPLSCMVPGLMKYTDLPELRELIAGKLVD